MPSSVTITVISAAPFQFRAGVRVSVVSSTVATTFVSEDDAVNVKASPSISTAESSTANDSSSLII